MCKGFKLGTAPPTIDCWSHCSNRNLSTHTRSASSGFLLFNFGTTLVITEGRIQFVLGVYKAAHVVRGPRLNGTNAGFYIIWDYRHPSSASVPCCPSICNCNASSTQENISNFVSPVAHCTFWTFRARPTSAKGSGYCAQFLSCGGQRSI